MEEIPIADLILDYDLYPRTQINGMHVKDLCDALEAGAELPPVIADKKTKRVVDGFHRVTAFKREGRESIPVVWKTYKSDAEILLDSIRYNSIHGQKFSHYEIVRVFGKARSLGVDPEMVANAAHITVSRLNQLLELKTASNEKGNLVPIKRTLSSWRGKRIGKKQVEGNIFAGGQHALFYINQVINILENDLADFKDEKFIQAILKLKELIKVKIRKIA